jgi:hypothetical protein
LLNLINFWYPEAKSIYLLIDFQNLKYFQLLIKLTINIQKSNNLHIMVDNVDHVDYVDWEGEDNDKSNVNGDSKSNQNVKAG